MKNKNVAAIFAFFLGIFGLHRFYLGQVKLGILYAVLSLTGISAIISLIDAILLLAMGTEEFNLKYNRKYMDVNYRDPDYDDYQERKPRRKHRVREESIRKAEALRQYKKEKNAQAAAQAERRNASKQANPYKVRGIQKYKDYDFDEAIEDFLKAIEINPKDAAVHFNLACSYSITEQAEPAFFHLDKAVKLGFNNFDKIQTHDALAYLRIQTTFEKFLQNGYQLTKVEENVAKKPKESTNLLDQLQKLAELRDKGLLTADEFDFKKKHLLRE